MCVIIFISKTIIFFGSIPDIDILQQNNKNELLHLLSPLVLLFSFCQATYRFSWLFSVGSAIKWEGD